MYRRWPATYEAPGAGLMAAPQLKGRAMSESLMTLAPMEAAGEVLGQLPRGVFLTVKHKNRLNTMTIGWGTIGIMWTRPVFVAPVRRSRYTYGLIERSPDFTVSVPTDDEYRKALTVCGTTSGRDGDKLANAGLSVRDATETDTPVLDIPGIHLECKTLLRAPMATELMDPSLMDVYPASDLHTLFYGQILACYRV